MEKGRVDGRLRHQMIHTYSLVHDDLPCMDDDELRRGRPTSHIVFGEALAVLSADALHTLGFQLIAGLPERFALPAMRAARELAVACGYPGMVAGQAVDLDYESKPGTEEVLEYIHLHKTAALIRASLLMGAHLASAAPADLERLTAVGTRLGLIFQVIDDILDVIGDAAVMGKDAGGDAAGATDVSRPDRSGGVPEAGSILAEGILALLNQGRTAPGVDRSYQRIDHPPVLKTERVEIHSRVLMSESST